MDAVWHVAIGGVDPKASSASASATDAATAVETATCEPDAAKATEAHDASHASVSPSAAAAAIHVLRRAARLVGIVVGAPSRGLAAGTCRETRKQAV